MLATVLESITKFIGILTIINGIVSPISTKIVEYFPVLKGKAYLFQYGAAFFLFLIFTYYTIKDNSIDIKYRIVEKPSDFDLEMDSIKSNYGATVDFLVENENEKHTWLKIFNIFKFNLLVEVNHPHGIKVNMERDNSDFNIMEPKKARKMEMIAPLQLDGRRKYSLYVELEDNTSFDGKGLIITKIYISPKQKILKKIFAIELGMNKIEILPARC